MRTRYRAAQQALLDHEDDNTHEVVPGEWRTDAALTSLEGMQGHNVTRAAKAQRHYLCEYYNSPAGRVPWQEAMI